MLHIKRNCLLLALPTALLLAAGAAFLAGYVPRLVAHERQWAYDEAKRTADDLGKNKASAPIVWEQGKGVVTGGDEWGKRFPAKMTWKDWDSKGAKRKAKMWGWKDVNGVRVVWVRDGKTVYARPTDLSETNYGLFAWIFVPLLLASISALTVFTIYNLFRYAKSREDFLAATAHDLATPLVGMRFMIGRDSREAAILNERMIRIVRNISEFMRLGGKRRYRQEPFDLHKAFGEAYSLFAADYRDMFDGNDMEVEAVGDDFTVVADELTTVQIIWNILGNDLKYAAPYGKVKVRLSCDSAQARIDFIDEGPGLTPSQRKHAFNRFWRARTALESGKGGFGIGLCVAREAALAMHGSLTLSANTPKGCVFSLSLPKKQ